MQLDLQDAFGREDLTDICLREVHARLTAWQNHGESLSAWIAFRSRWERLASDGLAGLADQLLNGDIDHESAVDRFRMAYYELLLREMYRQSPALAEFSGASHEQAINLFRTLDKRGSKWPALKWRRPIM